MTLFDPQAKLSSYTQGQKAQATRHQDLAERAYKELNDTPKWRPLYHAYFKEATTKYIDLWELVEKAKSKDTPGRWFLKSARIQLGINK